MGILTLSYTTFFAVVLCFFINISYVSAFQSESVARVVRVVGPAFVEDTNAIEHALKTGDMLYNKAKIRTELASTVVLRFSDGTLIMLKPKTQLNLIDYQYHPNILKKNRFVVSLQQGDIQVRTGKIYKHHSKYLFVKTPIRNIHLQGYAHNIGLRSAIFNATHSPTLVVNMVEGDMCIDYSNSCVGDDFSYRVMYSTKHEIKYSDNLKLPYYFRTRNPDLTRRYSLAP